MVFNGRELLGKTTIGDICRTFSHAIVKHTRFFETVKVIAHELGHS